MTYCNFSVNISGLTLFIESHDNDSSSVFDYFLSFSYKVLLTLFKWYTIDYTFTLSILKTCLDNLKFTWVNHHWNICNFRIALQKPHELSHCSFPINQAFIKIDIENLSSILYLILCNLYSCFVVTLLDQFFELNTTWNIASFSNVHEANNITEVKFSQTWEHCNVMPWRNNTSW